MSPKQTLRSRIARKSVIMLCLCIMNCLALGWGETLWADSGAFDLKVEQVTFGPRHHFFGYIGQCRTVPWNASGRYILGLEIDHIDRQSADILNGLRAT